MRQFICKDKLDSKGRIFIKGKDLRYLSQVLRLTRGDVIDVRFADGSLFPMEAISFSNKEIVLRKTELSPEKQDVENFVIQGVTSNAVAQNSVCNDTEFWLFQFMPKLQKIDIIVRQATECGVSVIIPVLGDFTQKGRSLDRSDRLDRIVREARQQSGSPVDTQVTSVLSLDEALDKWKTYVDTKESSIGFLLNEDPEASDFLNELLHNHKQVVGLACGCEGGMSQSEIEKLQKAGFCNLHLKTNVLRAETAAIYGIAAVQTIIGLK